jgi:hypothetical protein
MKKNNTSEGGFIMKIVLLIVAIIALKYFLDFDLIEWFKSDKVQAVIQPVWTLIKDIYAWLDNFVRNLVA